MNSKNSSQNHKNLIKQPPVQFTSKGGKKGSHLTREQFKLESCQKIKQNYIIDKITHHPHSKNHDNEDKDILTFGATTQLKCKRQTERLINLLISICELNSYTSKQFDHIQSIINQFAYDMEQLFNKYLQQFTTFSLNREQKQQFNKKVLVYISDTLKGGLLCFQNESVNKQINISHLTDTTQDKSIFVSPIENLHNQKEKKAISKIQSSFNEVNKLLDKVIQPRFIRKSNLQTNNSRSQSSSFQEIMQRSLSERKKDNQNNANSKQTLYKISRLINQ